MVVVMHLNIGSTLSSKMPFLFHGTTCLDGLLLVNTHLDGLYSLFKAFQGLKSQERKSSLNTTITDLLYAALGFMVQMRAKTQLL